jgi:pimeloyl-ACP methyl ester carboxylesterase
MTIYAALTAPTQYVETNGVRFAYRRLGPTGGVPILFLQHYTGTIDQWDPVVVDGFAAERPVIVFDNAGVGGSSGTTPEDVAEMTRHALAFIKAIGLPQLDLLGFSLGGFIAQEIALGHPTLARRIILAGSAPQGGEGVSRLPEVFAEATKVSSSERRLYLFFEQTPTSQAAGKAFIERQSRRTVDRVPNTTQVAVIAQTKAIVGFGMKPDPGWSRLPRIPHPVLVTNGRHDIMFRTVNSFILSQYLPNATLIVYPDSGHGSLFQHSTLFVQHAMRFLEA